jgi:PAS domain S-box-containing protein
MNKKAKILIIEHDPNDIEIMIFELNRSGINFESTVVQNECDYRNELEKFNPDIILSDFALPSFGGLTAFQIKEEMTPDTPFILVSGIIGEEKAVELIKNGVTDYVLKDKLFTLSHKILRALKEVEAKKDKILINEKLYKASNLYAFISQVNQNIVRVKDETTLFRNACRMAIEFGKFKMSWIGLFDFENEKISLIEQCGIANDDISLFVNASYQAKGPQDYVLCTGNYFICNDIQNNLELTNWKLFGLKRDINSCIVLPIKKLGKIVGTFNLYSNELNFSGIEEIKLLIEVTADISFALDILEKEKKQKETEKLIIENEKRRDFDKSNLNALINNTKDLMWSVDRNFNLITSNKPFDEMAKIVFGKVIEKGEDVLSVAPLPEMYDHFKKLYERAFAGESFTKTDYFDAPEESWSEISYSPLREGDLVIGAACHLHDVTETKIIEQNLIRSEVKLKEAQAIAHIGNWEIDLINNTHTWSDELYRIYGVDKKDVQPSIELFLSFMHPKDADIAKKNVAEALENLKDSSYSFRFIRKDGSIRHGYSESRFGFDKNNKPVRHYGILQDVTEIKQIEQYLLKSETFNHGVLDSLRSHIAVLDNSGTIIAVNESWKRFAFENGETTLEHTSVGSNYFKVCEKAFEQGDKNAALVIVGIKDVLTEKKPVFNFEYPCHSPTELRWFKMRVTKFDNDESMVVIEHQNITDRKLKEEEREKLISSIVQHSKNLEQFTSIVSHNLRAPVANIMGISNILKNDISDEDRVRSQQYLFKATDQLDQTLKDLNTILQVRLEINEYKEIIYFSELVDTIKSSIHNIIEKETVQIVTDFSALDKTTSIKSYMYSIFYNLISNSIKYRQPGKPPVINIKSELIDEKIKISFKDNGMGIDLTKHGDKIFGLYKRFHFHIEGKGLGLFMVKAQVETLGGTIRIESKQGEGAEFIIELPI